MNQVTVQIGVFVVLLYGIIEINGAGEGLPEKIYTAGSTAQSQQHSALVSNQRVDPSGSQGQALVPTQSRPPPGQGRPLLTQSSSHPSGTHLVQGSPQAYPVGVEELGHPVVYPAIPVYFPGSGLVLGSLGPPALYPTFPTVIGTGGMELIPVGTLGGNSVLVIPNPNIMTRP